MSKKAFFIISNVKKVAATLIVAVAFLYFWMNGPLLQREEILSIERIESEFSDPVMIGEDGVDSKKNKATSNTLSFEEDEPFGFGLVLNKKESKKTFGMVADVINNPGLSKELSERTLKHAEQFSNPGVELNLLPSMELYYVLVKENKKTKFVYLESTGIIHNIRGYGGEINVGIFIDSEGFISQVEHISSRETESYLADIKKAGFYEQFSKVSLSKGTQEIDAVSGATLTSQAIARTVSELANMATPDPLVNYSEVNEVNTFSLSALLNQAWIIHAVVIFLMFFYGIQKWFKKSKKHVLVLNLLSVIYIGFFLNNSFTYISFIHPFIGTTVSSFVGLYSLMVLLGAIWGKNTYCKYVCPFGNAQRLITRFNPLKTQRKFFISNKWVKRIRAALTVILMAGVLLGLRNWSNYELYPDLFGMSFLTVWFAVAVLTILATMVYPLIWCRLLCPTGSILDAISDFVNYKKKNKL